MMENPQLRSQKIALIALGIAIVICGFVFRRHIFKPFVPPIPERIVISSGTVQTGDLMLSILTKNGVAQDVASKIQVTIAKPFNLTRMYPNQTYEIMTTTNGVFRQFNYHDTRRHFFTVTLSTMGVYSVNDTTLQTVWKEKRLTGTIKDSLYKELLRQGYDDAFVGPVVDDLVDRIFGWRIDFFTEPREGDTFDILMEQEYAAGADRPLPGSRRILAAAYYGKGTKHRENYAVIYRLPGDKHDSYFDLDGQAVQRAFLRAPFTRGAFRISSNFSNHRFHPILRIYRPHHGTDYAASIGTPVAAIGKGQVIYAGYKGGYGNCVEIQHVNRQYISRYGHLSYIAVRRGRNVEQGQYIGKVGNSGLSTGPHLHFEMLVNGVSKNFLAMSFPSASSVPKESMADFKRKRDELMARFNVRSAAPASPAPSPTPTKS